MTPLPQDYAELERVQPPRVPWDWPPMRVPFRWEWGEKPQVEQRKTPLEVIDSRMPKVEME